MTSAPHAFSTTTYPIHSFTNTRASLMNTTLPSEPSAAMLNLSALAYLLGVTIITWCITRATEKYSLWTRDAWTSMPWARMCLLLVLLDSWLYLIITGVLLHGAPPKHEPHRCTIGIIMCLICYCISKALVYLCLIERVRAVWSTKGQRLRSPVYLFCLSLLLPLLGMIIGVVFPQAIHYVRNGYCVIGMDRLASTFLITYDICINLFLTGMFLIPLIHTRIVGCTHHDVRQCCAVDVVINALILFWVMQGPGEGSTSRLKSAYFSPIGNVPTFQPGTIGNITMGQDCSTASHILSHQENASDATVAVSEVRAPSLEKPRPTLQHPRQHVFIVQHPSRKRLSLPLATEMRLSFREPQKPETHSQGISDPNLFRTM
ncbi:hypothetical protein OPQ81_002057 [Rhizoctonia solani]|nr:hypothetical protein OPQ81_002057 [Rhizoctonia solani]